MKIVICGSISAYKDIEKISRELINLDYQVEIPLSVRRILEKDLTIEEFNKELELGEGHKRKIQDDVIKLYFNLIKEADAILVVNVKKNGKKNYIGGNVFLEMGFAYVNNKKIFVYNNYPSKDNCKYLDEILAMQPVVLDGDLEKIK